MKKITLIVTCLFILIASTLAYTNVNASDTNPNQAYTVYIPLGFKSPPPINPVAECVTWHVSTSGSEVFVDFQITCITGYELEKSGLNPEVSINHQDGNLITLSLCLPNELCQDNDDTDNNDTGDHVMLDAIYQTNDVTEFTLWYDGIKPVYDYTPDVTMFSKEIYEDGSMLIALCIESFEKGCQ